MSNFAIIQTGGHQYKVAEGQEILVEKLDKNKNAKIEFEDILAGQRVLAQVLENLKGPKIKIAKFKPKKRYKRVLGHRQIYTKIRIEKIYQGEIAKPSKIKKVSKQKTKKAKK